MRWGKNIFLMLVVAILVLLAAAISTFSNNNQATQPSMSRQRSRMGKPDELVNRLPIADYNEPDPSDPEILRRRRERGAKYDKPRVAVDDYSEIVVGSPHWANGLPAFPIKQSTAVVIGTITDARARMSNNKKGVYSEFTFQVEDILKNDRGKSLTSNSTVTLDREGGRVRLPSGKVGIYHITGQGVPGVGCKYVLFLSGEQSAGFTIVTGYELREGRVSPLDNVGSGHPFTKYDGADEQSFLAELRTAIATSL